METNQLVVIFVKRISTTTVIVRFSPSVVIKATEVIANAAYCLASSANVVVNR